MSPSIKEWVDKVKEDEFGHFEYYTVGERIGGGGFSQVRRVTKGKRALAMKLPEGIDPHSGDSISDVYQNDTFMEEASIWAAISVSLPDDIVRLLDFNIAPVTWMVMELGDEDMEEGMSKGDADVFTVVDLLRSLQRIHDLGYIHRDIKPKNIIRVRGKWKFSDFGLSKPVDALPSGSTKGTPEFMAPEQCAPKVFGPVDFRTDIWQMGILTFKMVTGRSPYPGSTVDTLGTMICVQGPDLDLLPKLYRPVLEKALARDMEGRYTSANEFADALEGIARKTMVCASCGNRQQYGMGYCLRCGGELGKAPEKKKMECHHCHRSFDFTDGMTACPFCRKDIFRTCPKCGARQSWDDRTCTACGSDMDDRASRIRDLASGLVAAIGDGDVRTGERLLNELKSINPKDQRIGTFHQKLADVNRFLQENRKEFEDRYSSKKYYGANEVVANLRNYPKVIDCDPELRREVSDTEGRVKAADDYCRKAADADSKSARMSMYINAIEICPDHPVARSNLENDPPLGPSDAIGKLTDHGFSIRFEPSADADNVTYCIFREKDRLPQVSDDSIPLAEINSTVYVDKDLEPGAEYYYSIYSKRWGILSKEGTYLGPIMRVLEVDKVSIKPINGGLRIKYEKPSGATRVRVWRSDGISQSPVSTELDLNGQTVYDDLGLEDGKKYYYLFVAEYEGQSKVERSPGVVFSATTFEVSKPVRDMVIKWSKADDTYFAKWSTDERVSLYRSGEKPSFDGERIRIDWLRSRMTRVEPIATYSDGMRFSLPAGIHYICPVIEHGDTALCGTTTIVINLKTFRKVESYLSGDVCHIRMKWPDRAVEAMAMVSDGPCGPDNQNAATYRFTREQYLRDGDIEVSVEPPDMTNITLFAIYEDNRGQRFPSRGVEIDLSSQL